MQIFDLCFEPLFCCIYHHQAMKQRDEDLAREIELIRKKIEEIEQLARGRGLSGLINFRQARASEEGEAKSTQ